MLAEKLDRIVYYSKPLLVPLTPERLDEGYKNLDAWDYIFTAGFLIGGLSGFTTINFDIVWPFVLIFIGVIVLARVVMNR